MICVCSWLKYTAAILTRAAIPNRWRTITHNEISERLHYETLFPLKMERCFAYLWISLGDFHGRIRPCHLGSSTLLGRQMEFQSLPEMRSSLNTPDYKSFDSPFPYQSCPSLRFGMLKHHPDEHWQLRANTNLNKQTKRLRPYCTPVHGPNEDLFLSPITPLVCVRCLFHMLQTVRVGGLILPLSPPRIHRSANQSVLQWDLHGRDSPCHL